LDSLVQENKDSLKKKCTLCGIHRVCDYKFKILSQKSEIYPTCSFCRDRLLVVMDFYRYLSMIRDIVSNKQRFSMVGLFRHLLWLRQRLSIYRIGSSRLFEPESAISEDKFQSVMENNGLYGGTWEQFVKIMA
jgi:hypothetical protein